MRETDVAATAVVTLTVEVSQLGVWGPDCQVGQIQSQAAQAAVNYLRALDRGWRLTVVGQPIVQAVVARQSPPSEIVPHPPRSRLATLGGLIVRLGQWMGA